MYVKPSLKKNRHLKDIQNKWHSYVYQKNFSSFLDTSEMILLRSRRIIIRRWLPRNHACSKRLSNTFIC